MSHNHLCDGHSSLLISPFHTSSSTRCEICGYQCRQRASLNWHMKKHTPEAHYNFTCEFCDKRFEKLDSVKFHKLKSHPDKQATWGAVALLLGAKRVLRSSETKGRLLLKKPLLSVLLLMWRTRSHQPCRTQAVGEYRPKPRFDHSPTIPVH